MTISHDLLVYKTTFLWRSCRSRNLCSSNYFSDHFPSSNREGTLSDRNLEIKKNNLRLTVKKKCSARLLPRASSDVMTFVTKSWPGHDFWSPTQPILPPRHDYGHQVMTGSWPRHDLKSRTQISWLEPADKYVMYTYVCIRAYVLLTISRVKVKYVSPVEPVMLPPSFATCEYSILHKS